MTSKTLVSGPVENYTSIESAVADLLPGDTAIVKNGTYNQRENISNLVGSRFKDIVRRAESEGEVIYRGGTEAWHLSNCAYVKIVGFMISMITQGTSIRYFGKVSVFSSR